MGFVTEFVGLFHRLQFITTINEFEQGLYYRKGRSIERRVRLYGAELEKIVEKENQLIQELGGRRNFIYPFFPTKRLDIPEGYCRSFWSGLPRSNERLKKEKILKAGIYLSLPYMDSVVVKSQQERPLNLGTVTVSTKDKPPKNRMLSCNITYKVINLYKAYNIVHDYDDSIRTETLTALHKCSLGYTEKQFGNPKIVEEIERETLIMLRKVVTEDWGLKIVKIGITDNATASVNKTVIEGIGSQEAKALSANTEE